MKADQCFEYGSKQKLKNVESVTPQTGDDEVHVRLKYAEVNFVVVDMREDDNRHSQAYATESPFTL